MAADMFYKTMLRDGLLKLVLLCLCGVNKQVQQHKPQCRMRINVAVMWSGHDIGTQLIGQRQASPQSALYFERLLASAWPDRDSTSRVRLSRSSQMLHRCT